MKARLAACMSRASDEWSTPQDVFDTLHEEFQFMIDVAARRGNTKCEQWIGPDHELPAFRDALTVPWAFATPPRNSWRTPYGWMNPPYSRCRQFIAKAAHEASQGLGMVCLVPSRTDTRMFHEHVWDRDRHQPRPDVEVRFLKGRLKFGGAANGAPFPSMLVIFRPT